MDSSTKSSIVKKSGITIGFLDDNQYKEFHNEILKGIFTAAQKYDVNIIRFGYYASHSAYHETSQIKMILQYIEQYNLDGLLFLGWTKAAAYGNYEDFTNRFSSIPILSIGTIFNGIPNVFFPGDVYIREILLHLIKIHHLKRIAFISHLRPDNRNDVYIATMKEYGIYDPELFIGEKELENLTYYDRGKRAIQILLDERKVKFDAVISLVNEETASLLSELKLREIDVPKDVAIVSYEDGDLSRSFSPAFTTIYFPWFELGFHGCEKLVNLIGGEQAPMSSEIPGRVIYRNSCGCMSSSVDNAGIFKVDAAHMTLDNITLAEQTKIVRELTEALHYPKVEIDLLALLEAFLNNLKNKTSTCFLDELAQQLRKLTSDYHDPNIQDIISVFRRVILPYLMINRNEDLLWAGDLFQQAQILTWEKVMSIRGHDKISAKIRNQALQKIGQQLITNFKNDNLLDSLEKSLFKLAIPGCYIFLFNSIINNDNYHYGQKEEDLFEHSILAFAYSDHRRINLKSVEPASARRLLNQILASKAQVYLTIANFLHVTDEFMGFALYEPGPLDERIYQALSTQISTALRGSFLLAKLDSSYKKLVEKAHREGIADISIEVLHNIGNILNSVNTSAHLMKNLVNSASINDLMQANILLENNINQLEQFIVHDAKGKKLMQFYLRLGAAFSDFQNQLFYHVNRLDNKVNSINEIITAQQNYAGITEFPEELDLVAVLEDALKLHSEYMHKYKIEIIRDYQALPKISLQRTKLFHILVNLINNAAEALLDTPESGRKLKFSISENDHRKYIRITDNGCGIADNLIEKIFEYGFTTKKNGHGVGLHSCMSYMNEMGGKIWAESNGPNTGATFVLQFR
jgi:signal transduction histidine kinase/DNA-binding LacI/PurR family transcriptional regulator